MILEKLIAIGLNKNEALVYITLLKLGKSTAREIIKHLKIHKNIAYDNLNKLIDKGIVSFIEENKERIYFPEPATTLFDELKKEKIKLEKRKEITKKIISDINKLKTKTVSEEHSILLRGKVGVRKIFNMIYANKANYFALGAPRESSEIMGDLFWEQCHLKQKEAKIKSKLLFNESLRNWTKKMNKFPLGEVRFLENNFEPLTETIIWDDNVSIIVWLEKPIIIWMINKYVAKSYRSFFNLLWNQAK